MFRRMWNLLSSNVTVPRIVVPTASMTSMRAASTSSTSSVSSVSSSSSFPEPDVTLSKATTVPFAPWFDYVQVIDVYDGDTVTAAVRCPHTHRSFRLSIRIRGIDCPEMSGKHRTLSEIQCARIAKRHTESLVLGKVVRISNIAPDKYGGRWLADITTLHQDKEVDVKTYLLKQRLAVPYQGDKKQPPADWMQYHLMSS